MLLDFLYELYYDARIHKHQVLVANLRIIEYGVNLCPSLEMKSMCNRKDDNKTTKCYLNTKDNFEL
jgi:hypothetical protein